MPIGVGFSLPYPPPPGVGFPALNLRVGWEAKVRDDCDSVAWEDITSWQTAEGERGGLQGGSTSMGRQRQLDRIEPGRFDATLQDPSHLFDPANPSSRFYGRMRAMARLQSNAVYDDVPYPLFGGFLRRGGHSRSDLDSEVAPLDAVDMSTVLNQIPTPSSPWALEAEADGPLHWWKPGSDVQRLSDSGSAPAPMVNRYVTPGSALDVTTGIAAGRIVGDPGVAGSFDGISSFLWGNAPLPPGSWTIEFPFVCAADAIGSANSYDAPNPAFRTLYSQAKLGVLIRVHGPESSVGFPSNAGHPSIGVIDTTTGLYSEVVGNVNVLDDRPHLLQATYDGANVALFIDSAFVGYIPAGGVSSWGPVSIGSYGRIVPARYSWKGSIGDVITYPSALYYGRLQAHYLAWKNAWAGDTPGQRIHRLLDFAEIPAADRDIDDGSCTLGPATLGQSVLTHCADVADSDEGAFFAGPECVYTFRGRAHIFDERSATSQATFTDVAGEGAIAYDLPLELPIDDTYLWNQASVTREGGAVQTANDLVAQERDLVRSAPERSGLLYDSDDEAYSAAQRNLARSMVDQVNELTILPMRDPDVLFPLVLSLRWGDRITLAHRAEDDTWTKELLVQGISHSFTIGDDPEWVTKLSVSSAPDISRYAVLDTATLGDQVLF